MKNLFKTSRCLRLEEIRKYLSGQLSGEQRYEVENHLLDCPLCRDAVEGFATHYSFEEDRHLDQLESEISSKAQQKASENVRSVRRLQFNRIAAFLLLILIVGAAVTYWQATRHQRLFTAFYESPDTSRFAGLRAAGTTADIPRSLARAVRFYSEEKFVESLPYFEAYLAGSPENPTADFLAGMAYLETRRFSAARTQLEIARINGEQFYEEASWYLALINLQMDNIAEADRLLEELKYVKGNRYRKQAEQLQKQLK